MGEPILLCVRVCGSEEKESRVRHFPSFLPKTKQGRAVLAILRLQRGASGGFSLYK